MACTSLAMSVPANSSRVYDPVTRKITNIGSLDKQAYEGAPALSISPDGRFMLHMQLDESRDSLMLAENFR